MLPSYNDHHGAMCCRAIVPLFLFYKKHLQFLLQLITFDKACKMKFALYFNTVERILLLKSLLLLLFFFFIGTGSTKPSQCIVNNARLFGSADGGPVSVFPHNYYLLLSFLPTYFHTDLQTLVLRSNAFV